MPLLAEVEALKAELASVHARVKELEATAEVDPLVEALNRRGFDRELARCLAYLQRYGGTAALLFVDLDGFKPVNDSFGHAAGDMMLKAIAATLQRNVRGSDVVARLGGDEFGVLLWNLSGADAATKALALEDAIAATRVPIDETSHASVGASIGWAMLQPDGDLADLLAAADRAMYARKRDKRKLYGRPRDKRKLYGRQRDKRKIYGRQRDKR